MRRFAFMWAAAAIPAFLTGGAPAYGGDRSDLPPLASHFSKTYRDDLPGLLKRRYIRVLTTLNKTNFFLSEGRPFGFEYALLKEYERFLNRGVDNGLRVVLEFIPVSRDRLVRGVAEGHGDIAAAGMTITPKRQAVVDFTKPYLTGIDEFVVTHKDAPPLQDLEGLSGRKVYVRRSSSYYESLSRLSERLVESGKRAIRIVEVEENLETEDILELVNSGAFGATVADSHIAAIWSDIFKNLRVHEDLKLREGARIAWIVRQNNRKLKSSLNRFVKRHRKGTLLGNIYYNRYYKENRWISNPLDGGQKEKIARYRKLFQKYASEYGFDWMLIMAMAYQESRLDQSKKSAAGAVGIMQILPETARDDNVGVDNVFALQDNVHAGVKYLAFLRDRYFDDPQIRPRDRVRFALAAYNAGPAKIRRIRALAEKMNLNPNRWFRNVEVAALEIVGQETVRYVSNINKYYVIYRLSREQMERREKEVQDLASWEFLRPCTQTLF